MVRTNCVNMKLILLVICSTISLIQAQNRGRCRTPDNKDGNCVLISSCQPIIQFLSKSPNPTPYQRSRLVQYQCELNGSAAKVCCPSSPIVIPPSENVNRGVSADEPVIDVSNHENFKLLPTNCGVANNTYRIFNGQKTGIFEYPWMALLSYQTRKGPNFMCGGSIINERYILTAAHCINNMLLGVRVGEHNIRSERDCEEDEDGVTTCASPYQDIRTEETISHPNFNTPKTANDIALIRLSAPVKLADNVQPICLPTTPSIIQTNLVGKKLTVIGFGTTETDDHSDDLLQAKIPVVTQDECYSKYSTRHIEVGPRQFCAGDSNGTDSCNGDSGGPLQGANFAGEVGPPGPPRVYQYGVVSIGPRPCATDFPGLYTKVGSHIKWILDNLKP